MPNWLDSTVAAALLVAVSTGPKLWLQRHSTQVDSERLNRDITRRLEALGFEAAVDRDVPATAVRAYRGDCRLIARNGDRARELGIIFKLEADEYGPVAIGYRNAWSSDAAPIRAVIERFAQDGAARVGFHVGRPAVIALTQSGPCDGAKQALSGLVAHASTKPSSNDFDDH